MPRAAPGSARSVRAARPALRLVACQLGRRQLSGADGQPLLQAAMGNSAASALREANGGSADSAGPPASPAAHAAAGAPAARPRDGRASAAPVLSWHPRPRTPRSLWQSLAEEVVWNDGRHICARPDRAGRVAFAAQLVVGRLDRGPGDAPALRQAARGRQARAGRQRALEHALADLAIDPGLLGFAIARRVDGQVQAGLLASGGRGCPLMTRMTWMAYSWRRLAHSLPCQPATAIRALRPGSGQEPVGKAAC